MDLHTFTSFDAAHVICVGGACIAHAQCSTARMTVERGTQTEKCAWSFEIGCVMVRALYTG